MRRVLTVRISLKARARALARELVQRASGVVYAGRRRTCPCCGGRFRKFLATGERNRPDARCPRCWSLERQRTLWIYIQNQPALLSPELRVLHLAPEPALHRNLRRVGYRAYVAADIRPYSLVNDVFDISDIPYPDASFDVVLCSHVLEHVPDDRRVMQELLRVLAPGGRALMQHPVRHDLARTLEDPALATPDKRFRAFGQSDHVRAYGRDLKERLEDVGFAVDAVRYSEALSDEAIERYALRDEGLFNNNDIYVGVKARAPASS